MYRDQGVVCPPNLVKNAFQTGALDNIDSDPKSTMAKWSFHGTAISIVSHVNDNSIVVHDPITLSNVGKKSNKVSLPDDFAVVPAAFLRNKSPVVPKVESLKF